VLLLDVLSGKKRRAIRPMLTGTEPLSDTVQSLAFAPDGSSLAVALGDGTIAILDPAAARTRRRLVIKSSLNGNLAFSPDGRTIAGGVMESVCLWDTNTGKMVSRIEGHSDRVNSVGFGPDGRTLLSCGDDLQVYLWSLKKVKTRSRAD
jgi:WD40 repeat protein